VAGVGKKNSTDIWLDWRRIADAASQQGTIGNVSFPFSQGLFDPPGVLTAVATHCHHSFIPIS